MAGQNWPTLGQRHIGRGAVKTTMEDRRKAQPDHVRSLLLAEMLIRRGLALADATPFLAHCEFSENARSRFVASFKTFLNGDAYRIPPALRNWPLATVWNFAVALSEYYGDDGHAVYGVLNEIFDVDISGDVRNQISSSFRAVCRKYGLCYDGSGRLVNDYLAQAGIARSQLHHVAKAFLFAERAFGPPPFDNTSSLNSWEDDAVHFLPSGIRIPKMVLEVDETAHYAFLFTRFRQKQSPRNAFEQLFFDEIEKARNSISEGHQRAEAIPRPSLIWNQNGLALAVPKLEGRLRVSVDGEQRRLRGGQIWPLPTPWPTSIDWEFAGHSDHVTGVPSDQHVLVFEHETGRRIGQIDCARETEAVLDAREVMLVASSPFAVDGEPAFEIGIGGYASYCLLGTMPTPVEIASRAISLKVKPKPRIWVESGSVAKGSKGYLLSQNSSFGIEFGDLQENEFDLALLIGTREIVEPIAAPAPGCPAIYDLSSLPKDSSELVPVRTELRLRGSNRALVRYKAWLWPGLKELRDELVFESDQEPANFSVDHSRHISHTHSGQLCLDTNAAYERAILAFMVGQERVDFEIPRPGISLTSTDIEGRTIPLKIGETLIVRDEDKGGSLSVRCPDRQATLYVRGRAETHAFMRSATRVLSFADLLAPASSDEITVERSGPGHVPIVLTRIVPAICPNQFEIARKAETFELKIEMPIDVDAIRFALEDETGSRQEDDFALAYRPVANRPPDWLKAKLDTENARRILATVYLREFHSDLSLATIMVRPAGSETFRPLRNPRGDNYAICLKSLGEIDVGAIAPPVDLSIRFMTLNSWMNQALAQESWEQVGHHIHSRWMYLGNLLLDRPCGFPQMLLAANQAPPAGAARNWVALAHPLQIQPTLYGSPTLAFATLAAGAADGSEHLALIAETSCKTIPEIHRELGLSPAYLMAFANFAQAQQSDEELRGFDFEGYKLGFRQIDTNPGARWFWQPGDELLGPAHYGAALGRMIDRLYEAGLEEEGANAARMPAATSIAKSASMLHAETLPVPQGIEETHAIFELAPAFFSGFARASRQGTAKTYLKDISDQLGRPIRSVIRDASFLIRLAPEMLAYYLLLWELAKERNPQ